MALLTLGALICAHWPIFCAQYPVYVGGIATLCAMYIGGNVSNDVLIEKTKSLIAKTHIEKLGSLPPEPSKDPGTT